MAVQALSSTSVDRKLGDEWILNMLVLDADDVATDAVTPVVTVTLPAGGTTAPTPERLATGVWRVVYEVGTAGRYIARAVASGYGVATFAAFVSATVAGTAMPGLIDLRGDPDADPPTVGYLRKTSCTDEEIQDALDAEASAQRKVCRVPAEYAPDLRQALLRRVARNLALRELPLAVLHGDAEGGDDTILPGRDPEVRRLEAPFRKLVMG